MIDLDNTLGNRTAAVHAWVQEFCAERSLPASAAEWISKQDNDGYSTRAEVFAAIKKRFQLPDALNDLVLAYQDRVIALAAPTEGAINALVELRSLGHTLAIVTNGSTKQQHAKIATIGFRPMVDAVIVSEDIGIKKPDPRIFQAAAEATGQPLQGSWMVGDSAIHDVCGAAAIGCRTAWLRRGRSWDVTDCHPTMIIDEMSELVAVIQDHE